MTQLFNNIKQKFARGLQEYAGPVCAGIGLIVPFIFSINFAMALTMTIIGIAIFGLAIALEEEVNNG